MAKYLVLDSAADEAYAVDAPSPGAAYALIEEANDHLFDEVNCFTLEYEGERPIIHRADGQPVPVTERD